MTDIPTDAFNKWHPDKAAAFPAQAVDVIHYLQGALVTTIAEEREACARIAESYHTEDCDACATAIRRESGGKKVTLGPSIDLAQAQRRWDEAADEIENLRAENKRLAKMVWGERAKLADENKALRAEVEQLETALAEGCVDSEFVRLRAEVKRCHARLEIDHYYEGPNMVRAETTMEERQTFPDGITVRDCTIKLYEEELERLRRAKK